MTAYTEHADSLFDTDKPGLGSTQLEKRDNLISCMEGDDTAPKLMLPAFERLVAGDDVRSSVSVVSSETAEMEFSFLQVGTVRIKGTSAASSDYTVTRYRNGIASSIDTDSSTTTFEVTSVDVLPFDTIVIGYEVGAGTTDFTISICTDGVNLWCANPSREIGVIGNVY